MSDVNEFGQQVGDVIPGWEPRPWPEPVAIEGRYVRVVPLSSAWYSDLYDACCGPGDDPLWTYRPVERPTSLQGLWMHLADHLGTPGMETWALVPTEGDRPGKAAGVAAFMRVEPMHGQVEVAGVLLGKQLQRTRAATEAIHLLMRYAFDDLGYRRFEWKCDSLNEPSRRAALRLGFVEEGRFRNHMVTQGRNRDTDWFSVIDSEWPAVRAAHEQWLAAENFDADGRQRRALGDFFEI